MTATPFGRPDAERERLLRRIETLRAGQRRPAARDADRHVLVDLRSRRARFMADRLAAALGGTVVEAPLGRVVRIERPAARVPLDRSALASLPDHPPPDVPLVCLDTETTGLGTAAGTVAFLVGIGWWEESLFRQLQLVLPDHADEPAFLAALRELLPANAWLVTYNGRGFDWPLLVTRFRLGRANPPTLAGHLDLLSVVRALFRHRLRDARLRTVEADLLHLGRTGDVDGWQIPARYLGFLRDGDAGGLVEVVRHNHEDVRSLARLLAHVAGGLGRRDRRDDGDARDLAALGRLLARHGRTEEALECLDAAAARLEREDVRRRRADDSPPWWSPRVAADVGGPAIRRAAATHSPPPLRFEAAWTAERVDRERARLLRRLGRIDEAVAAWRGIALRGGRVGTLAWVEVAKLEEHVRHDPRAALQAADRAIALSSRLRATGLVVRGLEPDLARRRARLVARVARIERAEERRTPREERREPGKAPVLASGP